MLYLEKILLSAIQSDKTPVVRDLLRYLKPFGLNSYVKKSAMKGLLYPDLRAERKLAALYCSLYDKSMDGERAVQFTRSEIRDLTGLSLPFFAKFLQSPPAWLATKDCWSEGEWSLTLFPEQALTQRAFDLAEGKIPDGDPTKKDFSGPLVKPEEVQDGSRNHWITKAILLLKHNGVSQQRAQDLMSHHVKAIPGHEESESCRQLGRIVASIYFNHPDLLGIGGAKPPSWLLEGAGRHSTAQKKAPTLSKRGYVGKNSLDVNNFKEGGGSPRPPVCRTVSEDQCFIFGKNYYSLPLAWVGKQILVFEWAGKLRVYDKQGDNFVFAHRKFADGKGKYQLHGPHLGEIGNSCPVHSYM